MLKGVEEKRGNQLSYAVIARRRSVCARCGRQAGGSSGGNDASTGWPRAGLSPISCTPSASSTPALMSIADSAEVAGMTCWLRALR